MKGKSLIKTLTMFSFVSLLLTSCASEPVVGPRGEQGVTGQTGPQGEKGDNGVSVVSIEKTGTENNIDTYTITYSDGTTSTFTVTNGVDGPQGIQGEKGADGHTPVITIGENGNWFVDGTDTGIKAQGPKGEDGRSVVFISLTSSEGNVDTYTITYSDGTTSTFTVTNGVDGSQGIQGDKGADGHTPVITIGKNGNWFVDGADTGIKAQGPKGDKGEDGRGIISITLISSEGDVDTYTITYTDGTTSTFTVTNGAEGPQGIQGEKGADGHTPVITIGENGNWFVDGKDTGIKAQGPKGDKGDKGDVGKDGTSVLTGHGEPSVELGNVGDSYIDLDNWNYYVKTSEGWQLNGNIKGVNGQDGNDGISVSSTYIDDNGDLIVVLSNGNVINAGHVKDVDVHTVKFYCDDLLVDTQVVKHGEKVDNPELNDFTVKHWYIDRSFEYEWHWYGCVVTEDMSLYGDYQAVPKSLSFDKTASITVDGYGFGTATQSNKEVCVSKATSSSDYLTTLDSRGIMFNKEEIGLINELSVNIESDGFTSSKLYYGSTPLSFEHSVDLTSGLNNVDLSKAKYFTIQNTGNDPININSLTIGYEKNAILVDDKLPTVVIDTKDSQAVTSRTNYVTCNVSTIGAEKDVTELKGQIKVRGNSTAGMPKKPYRIKLDKKNSLFGYAKAKNWVLLADYMDGSKMHNYTALKFTKMIRGEESFGVDPLHVNVILNGQNIGLYTFGEHIEAKEGRLNIEQDKIWGKSFDDINFYVERDESTVSDPLEIENVTYFRVPLENYVRSEYIFALKYPEKEDFEEELEGGGVDTHEEEFQAFFNSLKAYLTNVCNKFVDYYHDKNEFNNVASIVDMESLALYDVVDQAFSEADHLKKSFKMYRENGGLLKFGPNWDYDSVSYSLPYQGTYVLNPFTVGGSYNTTSFGETWGKTLFSDTTHGRSLFKTIWDNITIEQIDSFIDAQWQEMTTISNSSIYDCERWMNNQYYSLFDNQLYYWRYITNQLPYLKGFYA